jgi:WD40 repeat protein
VINILEIQSTTLPQPPVIESFTVPPRKGEFSFAPASFHASFVSPVVVTIFDVRDSKILLHTRSPLLKLSGRFSPDGCFFACGTTRGEIRVWKNTPTGYATWSILKPRLSFEGFTWSPTSTSILSWGQEGIQLLHLDNHASRSSPSTGDPRRGRNRHLVAYSNDGRRIATARREDSVITIFDSLSGTPQQFINTGMQVQDTRIIDNTIFVVDRYRLVTWDLGAAGAQSVAADEIRETVVAIFDRVHLSLPALSNDCSQIIFTSGLSRTLFLYDVKAHWGRGYLETGGNILGKLQAPEQFLFIVTTNHSWGKFGMYP